MKPRPARGAVRPSGQPGEQKHEQCDEQDDVHFFPRLSNGLQTCRRGVGFRDWAASNGNGRFAPGKSAWPGNERPMISLEFERPNGGRQLGDRTQDLASQGREQHGDSPDIAKTFDCPPEVQARGGCRGAQAVLPVFVHPGWTDHGWSPLGASSSWASPRAVLPCQSTPDACGARVQIATERSM